MTDAPTKKRIQKIRKRFIVVEEKTGEIVNAFSVEDSTQWVPTEIGTIVVPNQYLKVGDHYETELSKVLNPITKGK